MITLSVKDWTLMVVLNHSSLEVIKVAAVDLDIKRISKLPAKLAEL